MRAFCQRCEKNVEVEAENPRCPTCLRQSSLVTGESERPPSTPPAAPPPKAGSLGLALGGFALLLLSMVSLDLTSWMTLTDVCFVVASVGGLLGLRRSGFFSQEPKATASKTALTIGGLVFGLAAALVFWGGLSLLLDPLARQTSHRFGPSHGWGLGTVARYETDTATTTPHASGRLRATTRRRSDAAARRLRPTGDPYTFHVPRGTL